MNNVMHYWITKVKTFIGDEVRAKIHIFSQVCCQYTLKQKVFREYV